MRCAPDGAAARVARGGTHAALAPKADRRPARSALVLATLILGAVVANINTSISNVALPDIGQALNASNQQLTFITDAYQIAIASTVLYLGAVGDRYGRKKLLLIGAALCIPFSILSAMAHGWQGLVIAQMATGVAGGMIYPTTLSLITALYSGKTMTRAVALWMGIGAGASVFGPLAGGFLLEHFWWGSVFLVTTPLAALVLVLAVFVLPRRSGEHSGRVDHRGGVLSVLAVSSFVVMVVLLPQGITPAVLGLLATAAVTGVLFVRRERRAPEPLFDLKLAAAPTFWVAFAAGLVAFGALIGAVFIGQQFTQNVLGFEPLKAATMTLAMAIAMIASAPLAARLIARHRHAPHAGRGAGRDRPRLCRDRAHLAARRVRRLGAPGVRASGLRRRPGRHAQQPLADRLAAGASCRHGLRFR